MKNAPITYPLTCILIATVIFVTPLPVPGNFMGDARVLLYDWFNLFKFVLLPIPRLYLKNIYISGKIKYNSPQSQKVNLNCNVLILNESVKTNLRI